MEKLLDIWSRIPALALEGLSTGAIKAIKVGENVFSALTPPQQTAVTLLFNHADILFGVFGLFGLLLVLGSRKRKASLPDLFLTLFSATIVLVILGFALYQVIVSQFFVHHTALQNGAIETVFNALLPLDFNPAITFDDVVALLDGSGSRGRVFYAGYLLADTSLLVCTTILHRQMFSITYPKETNGAIFFLTQRLPILLAGLDLYENTSQLAIINYWPGISAKLIARCQ